MTDDTLANRRRRWPIERVKLRRHHIPLEELLGDLCRVASEIGKRTVSVSQYKRRGQFSATTLMDRIGSWNAALLAAGLKPGFRTNVSETELMENFAEVWLKLGRQPTANDLRGKRSRYTKGLYVSRFGTFAKALETFAMWIGAELTPARTQMDDRPFNTKLPLKQTPRQPNSRQRIQVLLRDGATCRLCGARSADGARLEVDHIVPWSKGGETVLDNLQVLCKHCNRGKCDTDETQSTQQPTE